MIVNTMTKPATAVAVQPQGAAVAPQDRPAMGFLTPANLGEAMEMAKILADSSIVPKDFQGRPGNVLIACQWGAELGLQPLQAMQSIAVINGRPSIWGDAMLGLVQGSGLLDSIHEEISDDGKVATCTLRRRGHAQPISRTFTMEDADRAGLSRKDGPWKQYPKRMLQLRARAFALRDGFADVLRGVAIAEEARDTPVMRDVTPDDAPVSTAEKVRTKVSTKKAKAEGPSLNEVLEKIGAAATEAALNEVGADCGKLPDADKDQARRAYADRLAELRASDLDRIESLLAAELDAGADLDAVLETYAEQIDGLRAKDSGAVEAMIARLRA